VAGEAGSDVDPVSDLLERLLSGGSGYSFFQAVRLLESLVPGSARVGRQGPAARECIRFRADLSLGFPSSDVAAVRRAEPAGGGDPRFEVTATFLGLYGPASPLPSYFTEELFDEPDESLAREFLDLFHHRALSLFYRAWEKYRHPVRFEAGGTDAISGWLFRLIGLDEAYRKEAHPIPPVRLLAYAGLLTQRPRSAAALRGMLADYFEGVPVAVVQCVERMAEIPADARNVLGARNCSLGADLSLGDRVLDAGATFEVALGPVGLEEFLTFLPPGENSARVRQLVDVFDTDARDARVALRLKREEVPRLELAGRTALLGWSAWLGDRPAEDQEVRFDLPARGVASQEERGTR
jgi:type VI secretion system protein ImpH